MAGAKSKRVTLHQKYKIQKRVKEHNRKLKRAQRRNKANGSQLWRTKQEANIPNDWPFKDQMLAEIEKQRALEKEAAEKNKIARKKAAEKKKKDAAAGKIAAPVETVLPAGMGAPAPIPASTSNAILLDAYTRRVWREIKQVVEESDIILEVLDARDPLGSRCFEMEQWVHGKLLDKSEKKVAATGKKGEAATAKPIILVLNKTDLVPVHVTQAWLEFFSKHDHFPVIAFHSNKELEKSEKKGQVVSPKDLCPGAEGLLNLIANFQASADEGTAEGNRKPIKVGIIGFGNVGKSSVLNTLARTHVTGVGPLPGYTKELLRYKLAKGLYGIDTPAVPTKEDAPGPHITLPLSHNRILDDVGDFINHFEMDNLLSVLGMKPCDSLEEFLDALGERVGRQMKGGDFNRVAGARKLFKDWNEGRLNFFTPPPDLDEPDDIPSAGPIQEFFTAANKKTVLALKKRTDLPQTTKCLAVNGSLFDHGDDDDEDEEDGEDGEDEDMDDEDMMEDEEMGEDEDEEEEEEEEEVPPPPPAKKGKKGAAAPAPAPVAVPSKKSVPVAAAPAPTPSASKKKKAEPVVAAPAPAPKASKKRSAREIELEEDEDEDEEPVSKPAAKKQAAAPKAASSKPTPKPAPAVSSAPTSAGKKGKGKK